VGPSERSRRNYAGDGSSKPDQVPSSRAADPTESGDPPFGNDEFEVVDAITGESLGALGETRGHAVSTEQLAYQRRMCVE
jgi:hypothetical protein